MFVVGGSEAPEVRFVPVTIGITSGEVAEVVAPPISGEVVTLGNHLLEDGSRVILPEVSQQQTTDATVKAGDAQ